MTKERRSMRYEDMTPTWAELLPVMLAVIAREYSDCKNQREVDELDKAKDNIRAEFLRMAQAADNWNIACKEAKK